MPLPRVPRHATKLTHQTGTMWTRQQAQHRPDNDDTKSNRNSSHALAPLLVALSHYLVYTSWRDSNPNMYTSQLASAWPLRHHGLPLGLRGPQVSCPVGVAAPQYLGCSFPALSHLLQVQSRRELSRRWHLRNSAHPRPTDKSPRAQNSGQPPSQVRLEQQQPGPGTSTGGKGPAMDVGGRPVSPVWLQLPQG